MKSLFTFLLIITVFGVSAQEGVIVKYFDSLWHPSTKENGYFYTEFKKEDTLYRCTSRYLSSNKLFCVSTFADTNFKRGYGTIVRRFENGQAIDSGFKDNKGRTLFNYHYNDNGNLMTYYSYDTSGKALLILNFYKGGRLQDSITLENDSNYIAYSFYENKKLRARTKWDKDLMGYIGDGFDEFGKLIPNYIFTKSATFEGGPAKWKKFLERNLKSNLPSKNGAPQGKYTVYTYFSVNEKGELSNIVATNNPGYGTKEEAIRVLYKSPNWSPAIKYNIPTVYRAGQAITFVVTDK